MSPVFAGAAGVDFALEDLDREFAGLYEFRRFIERGAVGAVYHAVDLTSNGDVAIKILAEEITATKVVRARFDAEAATMKRLDHENIVRILDSGVTAHGLPYLVMDLVDGCDLRSLCEERAMQPSEVLEIFSRICGAIAHAHALGVLHLDLKPRNILIDGQGCVRVTDFGIARIIPSHPDATIETLVTGDGWSFGYSAPEQIEGKMVDERADIYSLGAMLYELLTGKLPVGAWKKPSECIPFGGRLDAVIEKSLQAEPERRHVSVAEFNAEVAIAMSSSPKHSGRWSRRALTIVLAGGVIGILWLCNGGRQSPALSLSGLKEERADGNGQRGKASPFSRALSPNVVVVGENEIIDFLHIKYRLKDDGSASVSGYVGVGDVVDIPAVVEGCRVTEIAEAAFQSHRRIKEIRLADGIEKVGSYAFKSCTELRSVRFPSTMKEIFPWAFEGCFRLEQPALPEGLVRLGEGAFADCPKLVKFGIPSTVRFLERYVFQNCTGISDVTIPESVESMEGGVFAGCKRLEGFKVADKHPTLRVVDGVIFERNGTRLVHFPPGRYQPYAVPEGTRIIGQRSFYGCYGLLEVGLPLGLRTIETQAFIQCNSLESIDIPASVELVMDGVFSNCNALRSVRVLGRQTVVDPEQIEKLGGILQRVDFSGHE